MNFSLSIDELVGCIAADPLISFEDKKGAADISHESWPKSELEDDKDDAKVHKSLDAANRARVNNLNARRRGAKAFFSKKKNEKFRQEAEGWLTYLRKADHPNLTEVFNLFYNYLHDNPKPVRRLEDLPEGYVCEPWIEQENKDLARAEKRSRGESLKDVLASAKYKNDTDRNNAAVSYLARLRATKSDRGLVLDDPDADDPDAEVAVTTYDEKTGEKFREFGTAKHIEGEFDGPDISRPRVHVETHVRLDEFKRAPGHSWSFTFAYPHRRWRAGAPVRYKPSTDDPLFSEELPSPVYARASPPDLRSVGELLIGDAHRWPRRNRRDLPAALEPVDFDALVARATCELPCWLHDLDREWREAREGIAGDGVSIGQKPSFNQKCERQGTRLPSPAHYSASLFAAGIAEFGGEGLDGAITTFGMGISKWRGDEKKRTKAEGNCYRWGPDDGRYVDHIWGRIDLYRIRCACCNAIIDWSPFAHPKKRGRKKKLPADYRLSMLTFPDIESTIDKLLTFDSRIHDYEHVELCVSQLPREFAICDVLLLPGGTQHRTSYEWYEPHFEGREKKWRYRDNNLSDEEFARRGHTDFRERSRIIVAMMRLFVPELSAVITDVRTPINKARVSVADILYETAMEKCCTVVKSASVTGAGFYEGASDLQRIDLAGTAGVDRAVNRQGRVVVYSHSKDGVQSAPRPSRGLWPNLNDGSSGVYSPLRWNDREIEAVIVTRARHFRLWVTRLRLAEKVMPGAIESTRHATMTRAKNDGMATELLKIIDQIAKHAETKVGPHALRHFKPSLRFIDPAPWLRWSDGGEDYADAVDIVWEMKDRAEILRAGR